MTTTTTGPIATVARYDGPRDLAGQMDLSRMLATATLTVPPMYRGNPGNVLTGLYAAMALDIPVTTALHHLYYGEGGRAGMAAQLMQALIIRAGHTVEEVDATDQRAAMILTRGDGRPDGTAEWTLVEAAAAGLTANDIWRDYPADCLWARCLARLARRHAPDVVLGFGYVPEELSTGSTDDRHAAIASARPVEPDVVELLAGLDDLGYRDALKLLDKATALALDDRYAGDVGGLPMTVRQRILQHADLARALEQAPAPALVEVAEADAAEVVLTVADEAAGQGTYTCGCDAMQVALTGQHQCGESGDVFARD